MKLSEFVKKLEDLNYEHFHSHRVDGSVPDEPNVAFLVGNILMVEPQLKLDPKYGIVVYHE